MRKFLNKLQKDSVINFSFWVTVVILLITLIGIIFVYTNLPPFLPIFNHMPWGYGRIGPRYQIFLPVILISLISIFNYIFGLKIIEKYPLLTRFLFVTTAILAFFSLIFEFKLIFLTL